MKKITIQPRKQILTTRKQTMTTPTYNPNTTYKGSVVTVDTQTVTGKNPFNMYVPVIDGNTIQIQCYTYQRAFELATKIIDDRG